MLTLSEARAEIFAKIRPAVDIEKLDLYQAERRFLATETRAMVDNPAFDNSAMDGYAVDSAGLKTTDRLPVVGESSCGMVPAALQAGTCMRIFTGAPLPSGADAVEIQENVSLENAEAVFSKPVAANQNVRRKGEDFKAGEILYRAGHQLAPMDLGLLSSAGIEQVSLVRKPRVLVIATGNELVAPGTALKPGQIYESNRLATLLQLRSLGVDAVDGGTVGDEPDALKQKLADSTQYDFVITSGGASVGDHDLVKQVFGELGTVDLWRVRIKPGKPVAFGLLGENTHFFALPGNPVSSLVTYKLFVEPALYHWHGSEYRQLELDAVAANGFQRRAGRMEFLRASLFVREGVMMAEILPGQGSHMMGTIRKTNGLVRIAEDCEGFAAGETVSAIPLSLSI